MGTLYIDYTHSVPRQQTKVHGGANYTRSLLISILRYLETGEHHAKIIVLWPKGYEPYSEIEQTIYCSKLFEIVVVNNKISEITFESNATIFLPLLGVKEFSLLKALKKKHLNVILTIHGLRLLDYKIDFFNIKYEKGMLCKFKALVQEISLPIRQLIYKCSIKKYTKYVDTIITVSNYTLSNLAKYCHINDILLQLQGSYLVTNKKNKDIQNKCDDYILFVSGNRTEKNLARTIEAYKRYLKHNNKKIPLFVVGTSQQTRNALTQSLELYLLINKRYIVFFDYVDDDKLADLYKNASFLLYTSKSEGFGLPALEASKFGCPVVAAYGTSIPEVLGSNCIYVDPYSISSIEKGITKMLETNVRDFYKSRVNAAYQNLIPMIQNSNSIIIKKLISSLEDNS